MYSWFFQLVDRLPVGRRGTGFHQKKRCFLDASHKIMLHGSVQRCGIIVFFMPAWIIIPGCNIHNILKFFIVQSVVVIHQIGGCRKLGTTCTDRRNLMLHKIHSPVCNKTFPVQGKCMKSIFPLWRRTFDLIKAVIGMAPKRCAPAGI